MTGVHIKTRTTRPDRKTGKTSKRYLVYYRTGGRGYKDEYAGSFRTKREAQLRRDLVAGELAAGRDPRLLLRALVAPPVVTPGLADRWDEWATSRVDVGVKAQAQYRNARAWWVKILGADHDPATITASDVQWGIADMSAELKPSSVGQYVSPLGMVLDHCDVVPNPVRSAKVKLPRGESQEVNPPTSAVWFLIRDQARARSLLPLRLIEACGFRISECVSLTYGDIDFATGKIRVSKARTKTSSGQRWLPIPDELLDEIAALCPQEDRTADRRVFPTLTHDRVRYDLSRACVDAGVAARAHGPHDLRHRRISLWLRHGFDPVTVAGWAGHARASMSLDVYGHVVLDPSEDEWRAFWLGIYDAERAPREAPVRHRESE
jgi:site-specific recombinase XerC